MPKLNVSIRELVGNKSIIITDVKKRKSISKNMFRINNFFFLIRISKY